MELEGIAIVGLAAQLPSGLLSSTDFDYASFWDFLVTSGKAYEPLENVLPDFVRASTQVKLPVQGTFLKNVASFDNISLGISTKDARMTPYCARRLLDLSFQALLDSGIDSRRRNIGCFMSGNRPGHMNAPDALEKGIDAEGSFSGTPYSMANRISYALDLTGPSLQLDTACSSSLTALHLAATAIRQGDCEAALVGAAQINRELSEWTTYVQGGILAADGMSRPLDAEAAGFVLGSAIKATGSQMPLYVPNGVVLEECIQRAYERSGHSPSDADYVELHATECPNSHPGTSVGDPIEASVAWTALCKDKPEDGPIVLGAMKGNIGDDDYWETLDVTVPVQPIPLSCRSSSGRSIISISSFGIGGSMGHVVVQAPPTPIPTTTEVATTAPILFLVGGLSSSAVNDISHGVLELAAHDPKILRKLRCDALPPRTPASVAQELDDVYRRVTGASLIESTGLFAPSASPTITLSDLGWPTILAASSVAMVQIALCDLLKSVGIVPDMVVGHSAGETAAVYASGAGPKAMAIEIAIARGEAMTCTESKEVGMVSLGCSAPRAGELIASVIANDTGVLEVSCLNAPDSVSVSGTATLLDKLVDLARQKNIFAQRIRTMLPAHSSFMDGIKSNYLAKMNDIFARYPGSHVPKIPVYSTCRADQKPVLFSKAVSDLLSASPVFLEVACHPVLASFILARGVVDSRVLCPMRRPSGKTRPSVSSNESTLFLTTLGRLSLLGSNSLDLSGLYGASACKSKLVEHPHCSPYHPISQSIVFPRQHSHDGGQRPSFVRESAHEQGHSPNPRRACYKWGTDLPTTGFIEMVMPDSRGLASGIWGNLLARGGVGVNFVPGLRLPPLEVSLQRLKTAWSITTGVGSREREHARGFMETSTPMEPPAAMDLEAIFKRLPMLDSDGFYPSLQPLAVYGPHFQRIVRCHGGPSEVIAEIEGLRVDELADAYLLHPAIMDACIHITFHPDVSKQYSKDIIYLPSTIEHFIFYRPGKNSAGNWFSHITLRQWTPGNIDLVFLSYSSGVALGEIRNLSVRKFMPGGPITKPLSSAAPASDDLRHVYPYTFSQEVKLQRQLKELDISVSTTIYLLAMQGRDADSALGLWAVLRREIPDRTYILLGGIGSLGVDLAVWLYKHWARNLVLTSRRGSASLDTAKDAITLAKVAYLEGRDELTLRLEKCDATDHQEFWMRDIWLGLRDERTGSVVNVVDYLPTCSAEALWGVFWRTHFGSWTSPRSLATFRTSPGRQVTRQLSYLVFRTPRSVSKSPEEEQREKIFLRVLELLEVEAVDFDARTTFDHIRAGLHQRGKIAFHSASLLGGITWSKMESELVVLHSEWTTRWVNPSRSPTANPATSILLDILGVSPENFSPDVPSQYLWHGLAGGYADLGRLGAIYDRDCGTAHERDELGGFVSGRGSQRPHNHSFRSATDRAPPLIILPAGNGSIGIFYSLQAHYEGELWGLQVTDSTPMDSLTGLAAFWKEQICARWPHGPYRIARFLWLCSSRSRHVKMLEDAGEEVLQLTFIDHSPTLIIQLEEMFRDPSVVDYETFRTKLVLDFLQSDPTIAAPILANYEAAANDPDAQISHALGFTSRRRGFRFYSSFLHGFYPTGIDKSCDSFVGPYDAWVSSVKAPMTVLVAEWGAATSPLLGRWPDLGASLISKPVRVDYISGVGHFGIFGDARTARLLARVFEGMHRLVEYYVAIRCHVLVGIIGINNHLRPVYFKLYDTLEYVSRGPDCVFELNGRPQPTYGFSMPNEQSKETYIVAVATHLLKLPSIYQQHHAVFKDWYTAPDLPRFWSCDWVIGKAPSCSYPVAAAWSTTSPVPSTSPVPIAPVAFFDAGGYGDFDDFAFICAGRYYLYEDAHYHVRRYYAIYADPGACFCMRPRIERNQGAHWGRHPADNKEAAAELRIVRQKQHSEGRKPPPNDLYTLLFGDLEKKVVALHGKTEINPSDIEPTPRILPPCRRYAVPAGQRDFDINYPNVSMGLDATNDSRIFRERRAGTMSVLRYPTAAVPTSVNNPAKNGRVISGMTPEMTLLNGPKKSQYALFEVQCLLAELEYIVPGRPPK
ncbi:hypothetical protein B0H14DRAFT_2640971 [Mycena olivaceomarginata]|nr:hypothetical protein B0H14DRAFT_2640971 [Mycena olivaceomarginata]